MPDALSDKILNNTIKILFQTGRDINDVSGLYPLQRSLQMGSYVKILVREVLSDKI